MSRARLPRVLCLHGLYQSGDTFAKHTRHLQESLEGAIDLVFATAPTDVVPVVRLATCKQKLPQKASSRQPVSSSGEGRTRVSQSGTELSVTIPKLPRENFWTSLSNENNLNGRIEAGTSQGGVYRAWLLPKGSDREKEQVQQRSLAYLREMIRQKGPFLGIVGFSQGATMASLLCMHSISVDLEFRPKAAVLCAGQVPLYPSYQKAITTGLVENIQSLHVIGQNDQVILPQWSRELFHLFKASSPSHTHELVHEGGHSFPKRQELGLWLRKVLL